MSAPLMACGEDSQAPNEIDGADIPAELRQLFLYFSDAGTAFTPAPHAFLIERTGAPPLALTAYHVAGGASTAWLRSPFELSKSVRLGSRVEVPGAAVINGNVSQKDLAAFQVIDWNPDVALELADRVPDVGDTVYVLAVHTPGSDNPHPLSGPRRHAARVDVSHDSALVYSYLGSANSNFTSGAAVLDRDGRVVGVNVGSRVMNAAAWEAYRQRYGACCVSSEGGPVVGLAVHVSSIRRLLGGPVTPTIDGPMAKRAICPVSGGVERPRPQRSAAPVACSGRSGSLPR